MVALSEVQASLSLFAEAIAGEPVPFSLVESRTDCWPWEHRSTLDADGVEAAVVLPVDMGSRSEYRSVLLHQVLCARAPRTTRPLFDHLVRLVEDHRVVGLVRREFPGAVEGQRELLAEAAASALATGRTGAGSPNGSSGGAILRCLELRRLDVERRAIGWFAPTVAPAALEAVLDAMDSVRAAGSDRDTSRLVAEQLYTMLADAERRVVPVDGPAEDEDGESGEVMDGTSGVSVDAGTPSQVVDGETAGGGHSTADLGDVKNAEAGPDEEPAGGLRFPSFAPQQALGAEVRTFVYDEWDYHLGRHRPAWCRVTEEHLSGDDHEFIADVRRRHGALRSRLRRSLSRLPPRELVRVRRSLDGEEIDLDAAIEAVSDRRSGAPVDDRVTMRRDRGARDVATAFLVDLSASTSSPAVPPEPEPTPVVDPMDDPLSYGSEWDLPVAVEPVRRVIDVAKDAVTLMGDALDELGDRHAVYGFSGTGRDGVEFKIGKDFGDRSSPSSWAAVAAMKPLRYTRMGPAIRHAVTKLGAERARTKLLVVISDGYPQDTDYGRDRTDRAYGIHDTAQALSDAADAGIETFCVTIDPAGHDYLRVMCPDERYLVIEDVESLPERLADCLIDLRRR